MSHPKTNEEHERAGTYQPCRHSDKVDMSRLESRIEELDKIADLAYASIKDDGIMMTTPTARGESTSANPAVRIYFTAVKDMSMLMGRISPQQAADPADEVMDFRIE